MKCMVLGVVCGVWGAGCRELGVGCGVKKFQTPSEGLCSTYKRERPPSALEAS